MARLAHSWKVVSAAMACGILFGLGLGVSEMLNPARVLGFLDVSGDWDPTLAFVMAGALLVTFPAFQYAPHLKKPVCEAQFTLGQRKDIDAPLVKGAVMFGVGWGLAGLCPGPAIAGLASLNPQILLFFVSMLGGMLAFQRVQEHG